jgi:hypothetical protein
VLKFLVEHRVSERVEAVTKCNEETLAHHLKFALVLEVARHGEIHV